MNPSSLQPRSRWLPRRLPALLILGGLLWGLHAQEPPVHGPIKGRIVETMSSGGYSYLLVQQGDQRIWVATEERPLRQGAQVEVPAYWPMKDFKSKTLDRTFEWIMFASKVYLEGERPAPPTTLPQGHPSVPGMASADAHLPQGHP
ncbi:MAG: hypothetical protein D6766_02330, partial [Verrucomicrobia bacterium]